MIDREALLKFKDFDSRLDIRSDDPLSKSPPSFIDVFAGCGGLSLGLTKAGWKGLFAVERDRFAFETLKANFLTEQSKLHFSWPNWLAQTPWCIDDLLDKHSADLRRLRGKVDLLAGGPPCQGFSSVGRRRSSDPRNQLLQRYLSLVDIIRPRIVLIENVVGITQPFLRNKSSRSIYNVNYAEELQAKLEKRYFVSTAILRASDYGIPQNRPRFILVGLLRSWYSGDKERQLNLLDSVSKLKGDFLQKKQIPATVTARMALSDLEVNRNGIRPCDDTPGYAAIDYRQPLNSFQILMREGFSGPPSDTRLAKHSPAIVKRFARILDLCKTEDRLGIKLSPKMLARFASKKKVVCVIDPERPAPTITSLPDDLIHYSEPRTLTVRENARLQTFPDWFAFKGKYTTGGKARRKEVPRFTQVANAVPPLLAELLGETLFNIVLERSEKKVA